MTLDDLLGQNACISLDVVDILGIVSQQFPFILQQTDEGMSG